MLIETSESQPEITRPAKPRKSRLFFVKKNKKKKIVFILKLFKNNIKDNIFV
jgi:hypothetical protein